MGAGIRADCGGRAAAARGAVEQAIVDAARMRVFNPATGIARTVCSTRMGSSHTGLDDRRPETARGGRKTFPTPISGWSDATRKSTRLRTSRCFRQGRYVGSCAFGRVSSSDARNAAERNLVQEGSSGLGHAAAPSPEGSGGRPPGVPALDRPQSRPWDHKGAGSCRSGNQLPRRWTTPRFDEGDETLRRTSKRSGSDGRYASSPSPRDCIVLRYYDEIGIDDIATTARHLAQLGVKTALSRGFDGIRAQARVSAMYRRRFRHLVARGAHIDPAGRGLAFSGALFRGSFCLSFP